MLKFAPLAIMIAIMWGVEFFNASTGHRLNIHGIRPHDENHWIGLLWSPFLHGGQWHLISNTGPLFVLGALVSFRGMWRFMAVSALVIAIGGAGTWYMGSPDSVHVGASGLVFGLYGYVLGLAFSERSALAIFTSMVVTSYYGMIVMGVLPMQPGISWEGHLCGMLAGIVTAYIIRSRRVVVPTAVKSLDMN